ncbi:MAG TPA: metallophosphoesterase [Cyclobacteriaceae bacterium]|nr:metallophosphoesterase [Cyclobacteriaceae bacterium]
MGRTFVVGDIHGAYRALVQVLERSAFDKNTDRLICLGDVADGWPQTREAIDELLTIPNRIYLMGNHDVWAMQWIETREAAEIWLDQGGRATCESYVNGVPESHRDFFRRSRPYHIENNKLFVHAGIIPDLKAEDCPDDILYWDRSLVRLAMDLERKNTPRQLTAYDEVFVGHTPIATHRPTKYCEVWMVDTGAAWSGELSIMDIDTKEYFTSDVVQELYPGVKGR